MSRRSNAFGVGISSLPAWADYTALPNGQFIEFTTNTPASTGSLMPGQVLADWSGGVFVPDYGVRGAVVYNGGGEHYSWVDSQANGGPGQAGAYVLDIDARQYVRRCYPAVDHFGLTSAGQGSPTDDWGAFVDDGAPGSKHTYNCLSYMPASWGGGTQGSLMRVSHTGGNSLSRGLVNGVYADGYVATWRYDLSKSAHTAANPGIVKFTGSQLYYFGNGVPARMEDAPVACIDLVREGWWSTHRTGGSAPYGDKLVFTSKTGVISAPQGQACSVGWSALHHLADDDILVRITDDNVSGGYTPVWQIWVWQAGTSNAWVQAPVSRQAISDTFVYGGAGYPSVGYMHPRWSTILGCFVGLDWRYLENTTAPGAPLTTIRVWKFTPPAVGQRFTGTWQITWELVTAKAGTEGTNFMRLGQRSESDASAANGVWGKLVECPSLRAFVWTRDQAKPGQLIRLQGM